ncbi:hypothetical protein BASA50_000477 [Batrachochytrium salamandrivorans]|uniref:Uncharacterized protein n=1 Tax=Batrachochytrium salamandrivorans TaxID=1357716 RepID=A0ABQ8ETY1_9FUNG|nr:hypothetical protein BASA50_000477 [Batrachochytrium salamandrivorans]
MRVDLTQSVWPQLTSQLTQSTRPKLKVVKEATELRENPDERRRSSTALLFNRVRSKEQSGAVCVFLIGHSQSAQLQLKQQCALRAPPNCEESSLLSTIIIAPSMVLLYCRLLIPIATD